MKPKIISIGWAVPPTYYSQAQLFDVLGYKNSGTRHIFANSGINGRYLWHNPVNKSWQELAEEYQKAATELSIQSVTDCMKHYETKRVGCLIFSSCTGYTCPGISHHIAARLALPDDLVHANLIGMGCEASSPGLQRAIDYVTVHQKQALLVSTEICSCAYFPAPESDLENSVVNCLFGDASAAMLIGYDENPYHPEVWDTLSYFNRDYIDYLGFKWQDGRLKCVLHRDVPKVSGVLVKEAIKRLLDRNELQTNDINHWAIHPGGMRVLAEIQKALGLTREQVQVSYDVLAEIGNVSSATIIIIGKQLNRVKPPAWGVGITLGAGFEVGAALLRWQ